MFVKYNGVLRGLQSESAFLRNQMLNLCGAAGIADDCQRGKISFEEAKKSLNKYTTCLLYTSPSPRDGLLSRMPSSA